MNKEYATDYTVPELLASFLSHDLEDGEEMIVGAATPIARAAVLLAHITRAPNMKLLLAYSVTNLVNVPIMAAFDTEVDYRQANWAEAYFVDEDLMMQVKRWATRRRFFVGALQIDKYGNSNLIGIGDDYGHLRVRGAGAVGTPTPSSSAKCYYLLVNSHSKRIFVEKCDFISSFGWGDGGLDQRKKLGLVGGGPKYVLTPLCVMDFEEKTKRMRLKSVHGGATVTDITNNTDFELIVPRQVPETEPPTKYELELLRTRIDTAGLLRST
jgi:glutaconate CoA-transferase subunit B